MGSIEDLRSRVWEARKILYGIDEALTEMGGSISRVDFDSK